MRPQFTRYARQVVENANVLAQALREEGLRVVSGGTDNHMMLLDLRATDLTGRQAEERLEKHGIAVNKNMIPFDPRPPAVTSGIRLGTAAVTTRSMGPPQMKQIARLLGRALRAAPDSDELEEVHAEARALCVRFPVPIIGART